MEFYGVEYTIQESTCAKSDTTTDKCPLMDCEFAVSRPLHAFCINSCTHLIPKAVIKLFSVPFSTRDSARVPSPTLPLARRVSV